FRKWQMDDTDALRMEWAEFMRVVLHTPPLQIHTPWIGRDTAREWAKVGKEVMLLPEVTVAGGELP
ncbi:MAG TPA: hypothetical protein VEI97_19635, partial [bacterium]|nr:hypothetical protein [bacterium]